MTHGNPHMTQWNTSDAHQTKKQVCQSRFSQGALWTLWFLRDSSNLNNYILFDSAVVFKAYLNTRNNSSTY